MIRRHPVLFIMTLAYLGVVAWVTLGPQPLDEAGRGLLWRGIHALRRLGGFDWLDYDAVEFLANVAMFLPIGLLFLLLLDLRRWWLAILAGVALTTVIETTQLFLPGRVSDPRDLVANSVGAAVGVAIGLVWGGLGLLREHGRRRVRAA